MLAMACMVTTPAVLFGTIGYFSLRRRRHGLAGALAGLLFGALLGVVAVGLTFYEDTMRPPPHLELRPPAGFAHEWVYFIADPTVSTEIEWEGWWSPSAAIDVPPSGVVRVRDLGILDGGNPRVTLGDRDSLGRFAGNLAPSMGGGRVVAFSFVPWPGRELDPGSNEPEVVADRIRELEGGSR